MAIGVNEYANCLGITCFVIYIGRLLFLRIHGAITGSLLARKVDEVRQ